MLRYILQRCSWTSKRYRFLSNRIEEIDYDEYFDMLPNSFHKLSILIIQPIFTKEGPYQLSSATTEDLVLGEAESLVNSIPRWKAFHLLPVKIHRFTPEADTYFRPKLLAQLTSIISEHPPDVGIFINVSMLTNLQYTFLCNHWNQRVVLDRYLLILLIFKFHSKSSIAHLQVANALVGYLKTRYTGNPMLPLPNDATITRKTHGKSLKEVARNRLHQISARVNRAVTQARATRNLNRKARVESGVIQIGVVGYTNAGKTSLIRALSGSTRLQPRNSLFATVETTAHTCRLKCELFKEEFDNDVVEIPVVFHDTVGFISDLPHSLFDAFIACFEELSYCDILLHVFDSSHPDQIFQRENVANTIKELKINEQSLDNIINIGTKSDISSSYSKVHKDDVIFSVVDGTGYQELSHKIIQILLKLKKFSLMYVILQDYGSVYKFLLNNSFIQSAKFNQNINRIEVFTLISNPSLAKFNAYFNEDNVYVM